MQRAAPFATPCRVVDIMRSSGDGTIRFSVSISWILDHPLGMCKVPWTGPGFAMWQGDSGASRRPAEQRGRSIPAPERGRRYRTATLEEEHV